MMNEKKPTRSLWPRRVLAAGVAAALAIAASGVPSAGASPGAVSGGRFNEYAAGPTLGYTDIAGRAVLVRGTARTTAWVEVRGLVPGTTYGVHVHSGGCDNPSSPHYFFAGPVPDGDGPGADEIWPGPVRANRAGIGRGRTVVGATAEGSAASVVVHAPAGARIACADLS